MENKPNCNSPGFFVPNEKFWITCVECEVVNRADKWWACGFEVYAPDDTKVCCPACKNSSKGKIVF